MSKEQKPQQPKEVQVNIKLVGKDAEMFERYMDKVTIKKRAVAGYKLLMEGLRNEAA